MKKIKILLLLSVVCLFVAISPAFAMDNDTAAAVENTSQLQACYYFDSNVESDTGNGSIYNPYKELNPNRIPDNSVIYLASGNYVLKGSKTYANLTIVGENPEKTIVKYNNAAGFVSKGLITLKNVTFSGLRVNINQNSNLTAINTIFKDCSASNSIIYSNNLATVTLDNCTLCYNSALYGGAINLNDSILNISNSVFSDNRATYWGGAISCENSEIYISDSKFINNLATNSAGGAIYLKDSNLRADNLEMINCSAFYGGAITSLFSKLRLSNSIAKGNKAKFYGGAVYKIYTSFELLNSTFEDNSASYGGALYVDMVPDFQIKSNYFANNSAAKIGGAIYSIQSDSYYDIIDEHLNNTFKSNHAPFEDDVYQSEYVNCIVTDDEYSLMHYNSSYTGSLPDRYDLRDFGFVTPVKDQSSGGNCWAFASLAALESALLKATNTSYDLSEGNMKNIASIYSEYGWAMETNWGGYDKMAIGYLTGWLGPVNEIEDTYNPKSLLSPLYYGFIHIQNIAFLKRNNYTDNDAIKKAIMEYGAVSTSIRWETSFISNVNNYYYNGGSASNHAVAIIGWDDNYAASNFKTNPPGDGAWIIKNSWGNSSKDKGYFYVSYYDNRIAQTGRYNTYAFVLNDTIKYDKNYQYDIPGRTDYFLNVSDTVWYKNKFVSSEDEYLAAVSTYFEKDTNWDLSIYVNDVLKITQSGFSNPSYKTIDLDKLIHLNAGDIFEIVFKIAVAKDAGVPVSEAESLNSQMYYENISFISYDGIKWTDFYDLKWEYPEHYYNSQVACIKAFTVLNPIGSKIILTITGIHDNVTDIIANVLDEYGNPIKTGEVNLNGNGFDQKVTVNKGIARFSSINVAPGVNKFTARFNGDGFSDSSGYIVISNYPINTSISLDIPSSHNPFELKATVLDENSNPVESGWVTFNIDGTDYDVCVCDGIAVLNHTFKTFGIKHINATYNDLCCYNSSSTQKSVSVTNINTSITLSVDNQFNPISITANVVDSQGNDVCQGIVIFNVDDAIYSVNVTVGKADLTHVFNNAGINFINAEFFDESYTYNYSSCKMSTMVLLKSTTLDLNWNSNDTANNPVNITATVLDQDNNPVKRGKVVFSLAGDNIISSVVDGKAGIMYVFKDEGMHDITAKFIDVNYYDISSKSITLNVSKVNVDLNLTIEKYARDVNITMKFSKPIDEYITVFVNGNCYTSKSKEGNVKISLSNLGNGDYVVKTYMNSLIYYCSNQTAEFSINHLRTNIAFSDEVFYLNNDMHCSVILKDENDIPVSGYNVNLTINGKTITNTTNSLGKAVFRLDLAIGSYEVGATFKGDEYYMSSNSTRTITVKSTINLPSATKYTFNSKYSANILDSQGNKLKNTDVNVIINSKLHILTTDGNGNIYYNVNLNPGSYNINIINPVTGEVKNQKINVVARITGNKDLTMYYGAGRYYKVRVYDDHGNVAKGVEVIFKINGKTYSRFSDSNGYASLKINLNPKTYTIVANYNGYKVSNKVIVKPTLILKNMAVKRSKTFAYNVKLLNNKGNILKYKYVKVTFKGKAYYAKTNSKGIATFKIKSFSKTGKFTITATYGRAKISKKITVKK